MKAALKRWNTVEAMIQNGKLTAGSIFPELCIIKRIAKATAAELPTEFHTAYAVYEKVHQWREEQLVTPHETFELKPTAYEKERVKANGKTD